MSKEAEIYKEKLDKIVGGIIDGFDFRFALLIAVTKESKAVVCADRMAVSELVSTLVQTLRGTLVSICKTKESYQSFLDQVIEDLSITDEQMKGINAEAIIETYDDE